MPERQVRKWWLWLLVGGVSLAAAFVVLSVVAFLALPLLTDWLQGPPHGAVLTYEVLSDERPGGRNADMNMLVAVVDCRLNGGRGRIARVRALPGDRLEVAMYSADEAEVARVESLLRPLGKLEFRVLADSRRNKEVVDRALANPDKRHLSNADGKLIAWWAPVMPGQGRGFASRGYETAAQRATASGEQNRTEFLVLQDDYNVTGQYLTRADVGRDEQGNPCIRITFNRNGGVLFGELTKANLPDKSTGARYKLGIILDGQLLAAPSILDPIYDGAEITGNFTPAEAEDIVQVLRSGYLPARLRLAKKSGPQ